MIVQDEYVEHSSCIIQCKSSHSGQSVASLDEDGVMKCVCVTFVPLFLFLAVILTDSLGIAFKFLPVHIVLRSPF